MLSMESSDYTMLPLRTYTIVNCYRPCLTLKTPVTLSGVILLLQERSLMNCLNWQDFKAIFMRKA